MKILAISEYAARGSGYSTICHGLIGELERRGHQLYLLAFDYDGGEHPFEAPIIATDPNLLQTHVTFLRAAVQPDIILGVYDLTFHHAVRNLQNIGIPYVGIFPIEADPLIHPSDWSNTIDTMAAALCESEFGTKLLNDVGIKAHYFPVGIEDFWRLPTTEERAAARERWNVADRFVVISVGDNQERKNFPAHYAAISMLARQMVQWPPIYGRKKSVKAVDNVYWILNTKKRPGQVGYTHFELASRFGIRDRMLILEHGKQEGLDREKLRELYWASDAMLHLAKAEGLGLPIREAMACGLPIVGTDCTGINEALAHGRGFLIKPEYVHIDPFGNQYRRWANPQHAAEALGKIARRQQLETVNAARRYIDRFTWERSGHVFEAVVGPLVGKKGVSDGDAKPE